MEFVKNVNDEDIFICERLDKGVRQRAYKGGMYEMVFLIMIIIIIMMMIMS